MAMTSDHAAPEPIEADYEPTGQQPSQPGRTPPRRRSSAVTHRDLIIACCVTGGVGALLGAVVAIVATSANSGASTGTLAQEIDAMRAAQAQLSTSAEQVSADIVSMRSRLDTQADRIGQRETAEAGIRAELAAVTGQISVLSGAGGGQAQPTSASTSPLGVLLSRLNRLEAMVAEDAEAPKTTRQVQRQLVDLAAEVEKLRAAQEQVSGAVGQRQMALDAMEKSVDKLSADIASLQIQINQQGARRVAGVERAASPLLSGGGESSAMRAFAALEAAARNGQAFATQHEMLAALLPTDDDVASLAELATSGAPSVEALRADFETAARTAVMIASPPKDDGWNWLRAVVWAGQPRGDAEAETEALVAEARRSLELGDARAALEAVDDLKTAPAAAFGEWRKQAALRADLDDHLNALNAKLSAVRPPAARKAG
jgi:hypothetical protein